jgi:septation ring formation regulator EzrA
MEMESNVPIQSNSLNPSSQSQRGEMIVSNSNDSPTTTFQPLQLIAIALHDIYAWMEHILYRAYSSIRSFISLSSDVDEILEDLPREQQEQQEQLEHIQEDQLEKRKKLEELNKRLQAIEERRAARENRHETSLPQTPIVGEIL